MGWNITTIAGVSLGFELLGQEAAEYMAEDGKWGIGIDLLIFRLLIIKF